jgi:predicted RND superfamily exporter protein
MSSAIQNDPGSKLASVFALLGLIVLALVLLFIGAEVISIIDELMSSKLMAMDRDPPEGVDAWTLHRYWEILPSWSIPILIWLSLFLIVLWRAWRRLVHILS